MSSIEISKIETGHKEDYTWECTPTMFGSYGVTHEIFNATNKTIKYATFTYEPINHFGDAVGVSKDALYTGPLHSNEMGFIETDCFWRWETGDVFGIRLVKVIVEYIEDGSKEEIEGKNVIFIEDEKSSYQQMEGQKEKIKEMERESRHVVVYGGETNAKKYKTYKKGSVTFYIEGGSHLAGWESTEMIDCLELPASISYVPDDCLKHIDSVMLPRRMECISYWRPDRLDLFITNSVKKIVIPKETVRFNAKLSMLGSIGEIEFEDPCGWGVSQKIITDPKKMYEYIVEKGEVQLHKSFLKKILYKLGL